jgi:hypothetical protein
MPDHLHLLVQGSDESSLIRFVQHFKQSTGYLHPGLWQRSFYDRVLRQEEDVQTAALYVWSNPVVAGLAEDAADYPFSGPREKLLGLRGCSVEDRAKTGPARTAVDRSQAFAGDEPSTNQTRQREALVEGRAKALSLQVAHETFSKSMEV